MFGSPWLVLWGGAPPPPISAKKSFVFSDISDLVRRSYLILRELTCRYLSTKELRVFRDGNEGAEGGLPLFFVLYLRLCAKAGN